MSEVLTHAPPLLEEFLDWGRDVSRLGIEAEIPVYLSHEFEHCLQQWTSGGKRRARVVGKFPARRHALRIEDKLVRVQTLLAMVGHQRFDNGLPRRRCRKIRRFGGVYFQFTGGLNDQAVVRFL
jgi:hypothetical protein